MYVSRSEDGGILHGWIRDGSVDLFLWFEGGALVQAQVVGGSDLAEWVAPARLMTGQVRDAEKSGRLLAPGAGVVDMDRRLNPERIEKIRSAVATTALWPEVKALVEALLRREAPPELVSAIEAVVRASPA